MTTTALSDAAAARGLLYAPDPGSRTVSTIGGNVATCAGGLRGLKYGVTRNYVLGVEAVLPTGEVIRTGGRLWKDVAGYDLTRLLTGSEGTLAVITEITLALLPMPASTNTGVAYFAALADAGRAVAAVIADGIVPATLEFLDAKCIGVVEEYAQPGPAPGRRGDAAVRRRRAGRRGGPQPGAHSRAVCRERGHRGGPRGEPRAVGGAARRAPVRRCRRCPGWGR